MQPTLVAAPVVSGLLVSLSPRLRTRLPSCSPRPPTVLVNQTRVRSYTLGRTLFLSLLSGSRVLCLDSRVPISVDLSLSLSLSGFASLWTCIPRRSHYFYSPHAYGLSSAPGFSGFASRIGLATCTAVSIILSSLLHLEQCTVIYCRQN